MQIKMRGGKKKSRGANNSTPHIENNRNAHFLLLIWNETSSSFEQRAVLLALDLTLDASQWDPFSFFLGSFLLTVM